MAAEDHEAAAAASEPEVVEPVAQIVEASPTIIVPPAATPEPEPQAVIEGCHCLTREEFALVMREVIADMAIEEKPEPEPEPVPVPLAPDVPPEPSHPFFRKRGRH